MDKKRDSVEGRFWHQRIIYQTPIRSMITEITQSTDWNKSVNHPLQTWEWGEIRQKLHTPVHRFSNGSHQWQMTLHPIPHTPWQVGYIPRSGTPTAEFLTFLKSWSQENKVIFVKFEPDLPATAREKLVDLKLHPSSHPLFPSWTQVLDLTKTEEELLKNCHSKTRYNIGLATRKGVVVKEMTNEEGYVIFEKLYFETCARQHYHGHTPLYHRTIFESLSAGHTDLKSHILIAFYADEPIAAYELWQLKENFYYPYGGSSDKHRNTMGANLLMWEAIRLGKSLGCRTFDMWGSLPPDGQGASDWSGFTRFKEGYGTTFKEFAGSYDYVINPFLYSIYNVMDVIRKKVI